MSLFLLFLSAFGAATLLPLQSEAVLLGLLVQNKQHAVLLIAVASLGNILGSCVNWYLGLKIEHYKNIIKILSLWNDLDFNESGSYNLHDKTD